MTKGAKRKKTPRAVRTVEPAASLPQRSPSDLLKHTLLHIAIILLAGILAYSNTFQVPFQWDEESFLVENPIVKDLSYFLDTGKASELGSEFSKKVTYLKSRYVGYLTFALNFRLHKFQVEGYHAVNLIIHLLNALLVYAIVIYLFKTAFLQRSSIAGHAGLTAFISGLLFVVHPVQTEAVTYIYQRITALVALFSLLAVFCYLVSRTAPTMGRRYLFYAASLASVVLAMKTKENAFTLPAVICLCEFSFFEVKVRERIIWLLPFLLCFLIIPLMLVDLQQPISALLDDLSSATARTAQPVSRTDYLLTQFRVVATYIRLVFFPAGQNLDYYYSLSRSFLEPSVFASFVFLSLVFTAGVILFLRARTHDPSLRLAAFGIFWFFITLSVESSIIPINILINEYRLYLPIAGVVMTAAGSSFLIIGNRNLHKRVLPVVALFLVMAVVLTVLTYKRNSVWKNTVSLWADVVSKAPHNPRGHNNLANAYLKNNRFHEAAEEYREAIRLAPEYADAHNNICSAYRSLGEYDRAIEHCTEAARLNPGKPQIYNNMGNAYAAKGMLDKAVTSFQHALKLNQEYPDTYNNLGAAFLSLGKTDPAIELLQRAIQLNPGYADAYSNLANAYLTKKDYERAINTYEQAIALNPNHVDAHNNLGAAYMEKREFEKAARHYHEAIRLNPRSASPHFNLGLLYLQEKKYHEARREFETALAMNPGFTSARRYLNSLGKDDL